MKISVLINTYNLIVRVLPVSFKRSPIKLIFLSIIKALLDVLGIALVLPIIIMIIKPGDHKYIASQSISTVCIIILVLLICKTIVSYIVSNMQMNIIAGIIKNVSVNQLNKFLSHNYNEQKQQHTAEQVNSVTNIPFDFATNIFIPYINLVTEVVVLCVIVSVLFVFKPILCVLSILILGPFILIYRLIMRKRLEHFNKTHDEASKKFHFMAAEILRSHTDIRLTNTKAFFKNRFEQIADVIVKPYASFNVVNDMVSKVTEMVAVAGLCVIIFISVWFNYSHVFLLEFLSVFILGLSRLLPSVNRILFYVNNIKSSHFAIDNLLPDENIAIAETNVQNEKSLEFNKQICLNNIFVQYNSKIILKGIDLTINQGDIIGVTGVSGSGKSTLIYTLLGLIHPNKGAVMVDNIEVTRNNMYTWNNIIGYVPQYVNLLDGTVIDNIAFGIDASNIDTISLNFAAKLSGVDTFVSNLPNLWQTRLGENGFNISGGQRQRIAIARALYRKPQILIFDEATNALDIDAEEEVLRIIKELYNNYTIIVIAHRASALKSCTRIFELSDGILYPMPNG